MASVRGTLYVGVTNNIQRRIAEHKSLSQSSFTQTYHITKLVYVEYFQWIEEAIAREKQIKRWRRNKKIALIEKENPYWCDLSNKWNGS